MIQIPPQLQNPDFRFFLIGYNSKIPREKAWNSDNCYQFFHTKLLDHLKANGNYGVCLGYGNLICLDFDNYGFYESVREQLPYTFSVVSAKKRAPHYYYILQGDMVKKIGVDIDGKRALDIQAYHSGIVGPGSTIDRRFYSVYNPNRQIASITIQQLMAIFKIKPKQPQEYKGTSVDNPQAVKQAIDLLMRFKVKRMGERQFTCPFHASESKKTLYLFEDGHFHCFHCGRHFKDVHGLIDELNEMKVMV